MSPDPKDRVPSYRRHKQSGQAIVTLTDGTGRRKDVLLGKHGTHASRVEYARVLAEWEAAGRRIPIAAVGDITVAELANAFRLWADEHFRRPDGTQTTEVGEYKMTIRAANFLYGDLPAVKFGPLSLKAVRQLMIVGYNHPSYGPQAALARRVVNKRIGRLKRIFRWGVENEMLPASVYAGVRAVEGLQQGRTSARETAEVVPVARTVVCETLPLLLPTVADLVRLQLESGMRPGEAVIMRACDLDMKGSVWLYRPDQHKTAYRGHVRVVPLGPTAQEIVKRYLTVDMSAYLFSPKKAREVQNAERRRQRKTPLWPSHVKQQAKKRKRKAKRTPGERYSVASYARAIAAAIKRHNAGKQPDQQIPHWHPHQLRHTRALELKREYGLDVARAVLGHRSPVITEHYATLDLARASEAMAKLG